MEKNINKPLHQKDWVCAHLEDQGELTGTWCTPEKEKALEKGYTMKKIHEVWHFPRCQTGLFKNYVDTSLKIKEEASGFPSDCNTPEKRQQHVNAYRQAEGIELNVNQIAKNPARRQVAKLMLKSMWGNIGQRLDWTNICEFTHP